MLLSDIRRPRMMI